MQVTFFQPLRKDNERAKPNALYHVQVLNKSVKWHLSVLVLYPLGPPGAEWQRSSQESHKVHLIETGVQLCFDVLWLPQKRNLQFPVLTNTRSGFYLAEVWLKDQMTAVKVLFPHEVLSARNSRVLLFLKVMYCSLLLLTGPLVLKKS